MRIRQYREADLPSMARIWNGVVEAGDAFPQTDSLTPEEAAVARRARNAHQSPPRNADRAEYHRATALEAVVGYLYITGREDRLRLVLEAALGEEDV